MHRDAAAAGDVNVDLELYAIASGASKEAARRELNCKRWINAAFHSRPDRNHPMARPPVYFKFIS